jgi:hypothetical protein
MLVTSHNCPFCNASIPLFPTNIGFSILNMICSQPDHYCKYTFTYLNEVLPFEQEINIVDGYHIISNSYPIYNDGYVDYRTSLTSNGETSYQEQMLTDEEIKTLLGKQ